jgi:hypothetical protein
MSHPIGCPLRERIGVEFLEADVEAVFTLVDMAESECGLGHRKLASDVIGNAETVFDDIERRLSRLEPEARSPFAALVEELRRQIELARLHNSRDTRID